MLLLTKCTCEGCGRGTACTRESYDNHAMETDEVRVILAADQVASEAIGLFLQYQKLHYSKAKARQMVLAEFSESNSIVCPNSTLINAAMAVSNYKDINDLSRKIDVLRQALLFSQRK